MDITKCDGKECTMKETCWRYKAPKEYYQSYFTESPHKNKVDEDDNTICELYWEIEKAENDFIKSKIEEGEESGFVDSLETKLKKEENDG